MGYPRAASYTIEEEVSFLQRGCRHPSVSHYPERVFSCCFNLRLGVLPVTDYHGNDARSLAGEAGKHLHNANLCCGFVVAENEIAGA